MNMQHTLEIRQSRQGDWPAVESLYPQAFPEEDLLPLVRGLWNDPAATVSLVATTGDELVGHGMFTRCGVAGETLRAALLGPVGVLPGWQGRGVGSSTVRAGLDRLRDSAVEVVCVLGDPAFYGRLGFVRELLIEPAYPLPAEWAGAWQSRHLGKVRGHKAGRLTLPEPWLKPALWSP